MSTQQITLFALSKHLVVDFNNFHSIILIHEIGFQQSKVNCSLFTQVRGEIGGEALKDSTRYRRLVGKLIYLIISRPEIIHSMNTLGQFLQ